MFDKNCLSNYLYLEHERKSNSFCFCDDLFL